MNRNKKLKPDELKTYTWPTCAKMCSAIEYFGAGECDSICSWRDFTIENQMQMKAKKFYKEIVCNIKGPTERKIYNRAKKHGLLDTFDNVLYWTGMSCVRCREFTAKEYKSLNEIAKDILTIW